MDLLLQLKSLTLAGTALWIWVGFHLLVFALLALDLGLLQRRARDMGIADSLRLSAFYVSISLLFGLFVWRAFGSQRAIEYYTGFFIEKALSIDNIFVISLIFGYFNIPQRYQYRALLWGILAVLVLRGIMIGVGGAIVHRYEWVLYLFGAFLIFTGIRMLFVPESDHNVGDSPFLRFLKRHLRVSETLHEDKFFVRLTDGKSGKLLLHVTPLFLALTVINVADIVFAVDSIPAIFAVTTDTFIVYTANIMAILGLRALYFALSAMVARFEYLSVALALILVAIGTKIFWDGIFGKVPPLLSLAVTLLLLAGGVIASLRKEQHSAGGH